MSTQLDTIKKTVSLGVVAPADPQGFIDTHLGEFCQQLISRFHQIGVHHMDQITFSVEFRWGGAK